MLPPWRGVDPPNACWRVRCLLPQSDYSCADATSCTGKDYEVAPPASASVTHLRALAAATMYTSDRVCEPLNG